MRTWAHSFAGLFKAPVAHTADVPAITNPEMVTRQKREWMDSQQLTDALATWPEHLFEHFFIVGLPPDSDLTQMAEALCGKERRKGRLYDAANPRREGGGDGPEDDVKYDKPPSPAFDPQVIFQHPSKEEKAAPMSDTEIGAMCFPYKVAPTKLRRTPSLSSLNSIIYGKESTSDDKSCVFQLKVGGNMPLFGVCVYVNEMLHRAPFLARDTYPSCNLPYRQVMISAPRCYCLLTYYPFFVLHFQVLQTILGMERLHRTVQFNKELTAVVFQQPQRTSLPHGQSRRAYNYSISGVDAGSGNARTSSPGGDRVSALARSASAHRAATPDLATARSAVSAGGALLTNTSSHTAPPLARHLHHQQQLLLQQQLQLLPPQGEQRQPLSYNLYCPDCALIMTDMTTQRPSPGTRRSMESPSAAWPRTGVQHLRIGRPSLEHRDASSAPGSRRASLQVGAGETPTHTGGWYGTHTPNPDPHSLALPALDRFTLLERTTTTTDTHSPSPRSNLRQQQQSQPQPLCQLQLQDDVRDPYDADSVSEFRSTPGSTTSNPAATTPGAHHVHSHLGTFLSFLGPYHSRNSSAVSDLKSPTFYGRDHTNNSLDSPRQFNVPVMSVSASQNLEGTSMAFGMDFSQFDGAGLEPQMRKCQVCDAAFLSVLERSEALAWEPSAMPQATTPTLSPNARRSYPSSPLTLSPEAGITTDYFSHTHIPSPAHQTTDPAYMGNLTSTLHTSLPALRTPPYDAAAAAAGDDAMQESPFSAMFRANPSTDFAALGLQDAGTVEGQHASMLRESPNAKHLRSVLSGGWSAEVDSTDSVVPEGDRVSPGQQQRLQMAFSDGERISPQQRLLHQQAALIDGERKSPRPQQQQTVMHGGERTSPGQQQWQTAFLEREKTSPRPQQQQAAVHDRERSSPQNKQQQQNKVAAQEEGIAIPASQDAYLASSGFESIDPCAAAAAAGTTDAGPAGPMGELPSVGSSGSTSAARSGSGSASGSTSHNKFNSTSAGPTTVSASITGGGNLRSTTSSSAAMPAHPPAGGARTVRNFSMTCIPVTANAGQLRSTVTAPLPSTAAGAAASAAAAAAVPSIIQRMMESVHMAQSLPTEQKQRLLSPPAHIPSLDVVSRHNSAPTLNKAPRRTFGLRTHNDPTTPSTSHHPTRLNPAHTTASGTVRNFGGSTTDIHLNSQLGSSNIPADPAPEANTTERASTPSRFQASAPQPEASAGSQSSTAPRDASFAVRSGSTQRLRAAFEQGATSLSAAAPATLATTTSVAPAGGASYHYSRPFLKPATPQSLTSVTPIPSTSAAAAAAAAAATATAATASLVENCACSDGLTDPYERTHSSLCADDLGHPHSSKKKSTAGPVAEGVTPASDESRYVTHHTGTAPPPQTTNRLPTGEPTRSQAAPSSPRHFAPHRTPPPAVTVGPASDTASSSTGARPTSTQRAFQSKRRQTAGDIEALTASNTPTSGAELGKSVPASHAIRPAISDAVFGAGVRSSRSLIPATPGAPASRPAFLSGRLGSMSGTAAEPGLLPFQQVSLRPMEIRADYTPLPLSAPTSPKKPLSPVLPSQQQRAPFIANKARTQSLTSVGQGQAQSAGGATQSAGTVSGQVQSAGLAAGGARERRLQMQKKLLEEQELKRQDKLRVVKQEAQDVALLQQQQQANAKQASASVRRPFDANKSKVLLAQQQREREQQAEQERQAQRHKREQQQQQAQKQQEHQAEQKQCEQEQQAKQDLQDVIRRKEEHQIQQQQQEQQQEEQAGHLDFLQKIEQTLLLQQQQQAQKLLHQQSWERTSQQQQQIENALQAAANSHSSPDLPSSTSVVHSPSSFQAPGYIPTTPNTAAVFHTATAMSVIDGTVASYDTQRAILKSSTPTTTTASSNDTITAMPVILDTTLDISLTPINATALGVNAAKPTAAAIHDTDTSTLTSITGPDTAATAVPVSSDPSPDTAVRIATSAQLVQRLTQQLEARKAQQAQTSTQRIIPTAVQTVHTRQPQLATPDQLRSCSSADQPAIPHPHALGRARNMSSSGLPASYPPHGSDTPPFQTPPMEDEQSPTSVMQLLEEGAGWQQRSRSVTLRDPQHGLQQPQRQTDLLSHLQPGAAQGADRTGSFRLSESSSVCSYSFMPMPPFLQSNLARPGDTASGPLPSSDTASSPLPSSISRVMETLQQFDPSTSRTSAAGCSSLSTQQPLALNPPSLTHFQADAASNDSSSAHITHAQSAPNPHPSQPSDFVDERSSNTSSIAYFSQPPLQLHLQIQQSNLTRFSHNAPAESPLTLMNGLPSYGDGYSSSSSSLEVEELRSPIASAQSSPRRATIGMRGGGGIEAGEEGDLSRPGSLVLSDFASMDIRGSGELLVKVASQEAGLDQDVGDVGIPSAAAVAALENVQDASLPPSTHPAPPVSDTCQLLQTSSHSLAIPQQQQQQHQRQHHSSSGVGSPPGGGPRSPNKLSNLNPITRSYSLTGFNTNPLFSVPVAPVLDHDHLLDSTRAPDAPSGLQQSMQDLTPGRAASPPAPAAAADIDLAAAAAATSCTTTIAALHHVDNPPMLLVSPFANQGHQDPAVHSQQAPSSQPDFLPLHAVAERFAPHLVSLEGRQADDAHKAHSGGENVVTTEFGTVEPVVDLDLDLCVDLEDGRTEESEIGNGSASCEDAAAAATAADVEETSAAASSEVAAFSPLVVLDTLYNVGSLHPGEGLDLKFGGISTLSYHRTPLARKYSIIGSSRDVHGYAEAELAANLQLWTVAALARSLSLDNILSLLNAVLLEQQIVVFCPNLAIQSAIVLSLIPLLAPFQWHFTLLPITPQNMLCFLDAPLPFVLGVQYKTADVAWKCTDLVRVNVYKDRVRNTGSLPVLPGLKQLTTALLPHYTKMRKNIATAHRQPVYVLNEETEAAAASFLNIFTSHMTGIIKLSPHVMTNVGMDKRTGILMKDWFVSTIPLPDRPWVDDFMATQMFSTHCDDVLRSEFERT